MQNFRMIDVGQKEVTRRRAIACGEIFMNRRTVEMIRNGDSPKGNILAMAEVAGIMAAKNTWQQLPLCHPLILDSVKIWFEIESDSVKASCEVICHAKTGVEMEALSGLNTCLLTIYDLAKAVDPVIEIKNIYLKQKEGGKTGLWVHPKIKNEETRQNLEQNLPWKNLKFSVVTLSDRASKGLYEDNSGKRLISLAKSMGGELSCYDLIPDEKEKVAEIIHKNVQNKTDVILLTGGTGLGKRDITPEVVSSMADKELKSFGDLQRQYGSYFTRKSWLSRSSAYSIGDSIAILFPGSTKAVEQGFAAVGDLVPHAVSMLRGEDHV